MFNVDLLKFCNLNLCHMLSWFLCYTLYFNSDGLSFDNSTPTRLHRSDFSFQCNRFDKVASKRFRLSHTEITIKWFVANLQDSVSSSGHIPLNLSQKIEFCKFLRFESIWWQWIDIFKRTFRFGWIVLSFSDLVSSLVSSFASSAASSASCSGLP